MMFPGRSALALGLSRPFGGAFPRPSAGGTPPDPPADAVVRVAAAVTRRLVDAYAGALIRVRRSSDNSEADIGMTADHTLDTGALLLHAKATHITSAGALYCPGTGSQNQGASIPDAAALDLTDDLELWALIEPTTWAGNSGSAAQMVVGKWGTGANQRSYYLGLEYDGSSLYSLSFRTTTGGTSGSAWTVWGTASIAGWTGRKWIRISRRKSDGRIQFFHADPGVDTTLPGSWTQLGSNRTGSTAAIHIGTALFRCGSQDTNTSLNYSGKIERVRLLSGLLGAESVVADIDFTADAAPSNTSDTFVCDTGQTVTIARAGDSAYLTKIYDQSGSGRDFAQATAGNQPRVVNAGVLELFHEAPSARFRPGSETHHMDAAVTIDGEVSVVAVFGLESTGVADSRVVSLGAATDDDADGLAIAKGASNGGASWYATSGAVDGPEVVAPLGDMQLGTVIADRSTLATYADGTLVPTSPAKSTGVDITTARIGNALQGSLQHGGYISEILIYEGALT